MFLFRFEGWLARLRAGDLRTMDIDGACHCGKISYRAKVNPDNVIVCHCADCQASSGAPYRANVPVLIENLELSGQAKTYVKTGGSGAQVVIGFCGDCGSALYSHRQDRPTYFNLRLGAVRQRAQLPPKAQYFGRSAMPWVMDLAAIPMDPPPRSRPPQTKST
jgi:hypothetical protein